MFSKCPFFPELWLQARGSTLCSRRYYEQLHQEKDVPPQTAKHRKTHGRQTWGGVEGYKVRYKKGSGRKGEDIEREGAGRKRESRTPSTMTSDIK